MATNEDNLEYAVSQAVDDVLSDFDRHNLGAQLTSAEARQFASEHAQLNALIRAHEPLPSIDFNALATSISTAIEAEAAHVPSALPIRPTWTRRLAWAAAVILTVTAAWPLLPNRAQPTSPGGMATVQGPTTGQADGNGIVEVKIGPSEIMIQHGLQAGLGTDPKQPKPVVVITSATMPSDVRPY